MLGPRNAKGKARPLPSRSHGLEENPSKTGDEPRAAQSRAGADHDERTPGGGQGSSAVSENYGKLGSNDLI